MQAKKLTKAAKVGILYLIERGGRVPLKILRQDITKMQVDAIVNTTNADMIGYSGVDLAVHEAAGPELEIECATLTPLDLGEAKITKGYNLDAKYIIHTSGPYWLGGVAKEDVVLQSCYWESLKLAVEYGCHSVALPLISAGAYGFPKDRVLKFAIRVITEFLLEHELDVYLCVFDRTSYEFSKQLFSEISDLLDDTYTETCRERSETVTRSLSTKAVDDGSLSEYMKSMDKAFAYKLFDWIDARGMTDVECYKKANIDKKTFSKIKCNPDTYKPSKQTAVAFAIALRLTLEETQDLLASAGLTLSGSFTFDKIIRYFIQKQVYDIFEINEALFEFDQILLGC